VSIPNWWHLGLLRVTEDFGRVVVADSARDTTGKAWILLKTSRIQDSKNQHAVFAALKNTGVFVLNDITTT
jgi:predicted RNA-binding protein YlxR (DUF448 family)